VLIRNKNFGGGSMDNWKLRGLWIEHYDDLRNAKINAILAKSFERRFRCGVT
jgi:hypothetical protein